MKKLYWRISSRECRILITVFVSALVCICFCPSEGLAGGFRMAPEFFQFNTPRFMRFTGVLHPLEGTRRKSGVDAYKVFIQDREWMMNIEKAEDLTGSTVGTSVLSLIFPPKLYFMGSDKLLNQLESPDIAGKRITIQGSLYVSNGWFLITSVRG